MLREGDKTATVCITAWNTEVHLFGNRASCLNSPDSARDWNRSNSTAETYSLPAMLIVVIQPRLRHRQPVVLATPSSLSQALYETNFDFSYVLCIAEPYSANCVLFSMGLNQYALQSRLSSWKRDSIRFEIAFHLFPGVALLDWQTRFQSGCFDPRE